MNTLTQMKCIPCREGSPALPDEEIEEHRLLIPKWKLVDFEGIRRLQRVFLFADFAEALAFTNRIGALAETVDHHPAILTEWGKTTISWWTHKIRGLHRNDFIMAAKTDAEYTDFSTQFQG